MPPEASETERSAKWRTYYEKLKGRPPRETLLFALERFAEEGRDGADCRAVDLGSGGGRDTIELLRRGWRVLAIDAEPAATEALSARPDLPEGARLETRVARFDETDWPAVDLVNSSFALPLCPQESFPALWRRILDSLRPGGRFAGQLYGPRDSWAGDPSITFLERRQIEALLEPLAIEMLDEEEDDSTTPRGQTKHWHVFHIVVRRP